LPKGETLRGEATDSTDTERGMKIQFRQQDCGLFLDVSAGLREAAFVNFGKAEVGLAVANLLWVPRGKVDRKKQSEGSGKIP
jgi:hypothetical protein